MAYVVLARKWRPMSFDDLIGQGHVATTLANAIAANRVAHAFLFTGVRGVGKTTSARILAKALNCMSAEGPTATPCLTCAACEEIARGQDMDVQEIDGASYNGVEEVRKLQDSLPYRPSRDRYKVIIVDEVHMLSTAAWNAFLKTLEEPPPHVKFIFATTEAHKVPITILSRVQRFDFKLIASQAIAARLTHVLEQEGVRARPEAIAIIAREAGGSMRDAMSLLDQVIAFGADELTEDEVARILGVASRQALGDVTTALVEGDPASCLRVVSALAEQGFDMANVARHLLSMLRDLVVARVCEDPGQLLDLADDERAAVTGLASRSDADDLVRLHQGFASGYDEVVRSEQPRAAMEMLLVRLARRPPLLPVDALLERLEALERRLGPGAPRSGAGGAGGSRRRGPERRQLEAAEPPTRDALDGKPSGAPQTRPRQARATTGGRPATAPGPDSSGDPPPASPEFPPYPEPPSEPAPGPGRRPSSLEPTPGGKAAAPASLEPPRRKPDRLEDFRALIESLRDDRPELAAFLEHAALLSFNPDSIVLGYEPDSLFAAQVDAPDARQLIEKAAARFFGKRPEAGPRVRVETGSAEASELDTLAAIGRREREQRRRQAIERARRHPLVQEASRVLGARLRDIRIPES